MLKIIGKRNKIRSSTLYKGSGFKLAIFLLLSTEILEYLMVLNDCIKDHSEYYLFAYFSEVNNFPLAQ